jgi:hypothetical protein
MLATTTRFRHLTKCDRSPDWNPPAAHVASIQYANEQAFGHPRQLTSIHTFPVGGRSERQEPPTFVPHMRQHVPQIGQAPQLAAGVSRSFLRSARLKRTGARNAQREAQG